MSISVLYQEPAPAASPALSGPLLAARAAALFTSDLSALSQHTRI